MSALAKALKEASLTKAQLGLELEELEAAALLVQEEETARKAACSLSTQQTLGSSPEASDSEGSESDSESESESGSHSTASSGPGDSASEHEDPGGSRSAPAPSLRGPFVHTSSILLVGQQQSQALARAPGACGPLIEELGAQLRTTLQVSQPEYATAESHSSVRDGEEAQRPNE